MFSIFGQQKIEGEKILSHKEWKQVYSDYKVDDSLVETIKLKAEENIRIDVYLAFWCGDSEVNVPKFMKILDKVNNKKLLVNYYTVERKPDKNTKYYVKELKVERIPTFIFYRDDKEIGRIIENPKKDMTEDFLEIIF